VRFLVKRFIDFFGAAVFIVMLFPVLLIVPIIVKFSMGSPIFFRQKRIGYKGKVFTLLKFRTMKEAKDNLGRDLPDEERLCRLGLFLRKTTIDELPELFNVLRGDMSIVGPRPLLVEYKNIYTKEQNSRHDVLPGMAGPVVAYGRNALSWEEKFKLDIWYAQNHSLLLDMKIFLICCFRVFRQEGVAAAGYASMPKFEGSKNHNDSI
jgi:sugar transferase EpsL